MRPLGPARSTGGHLPATVGFSSAVYAINWTAGSQSERQSTKTPLEFRYFRVEGCIPESGHAFNVTRQIFVLYAQEYQRLWCPSQMI